MLVAQRFVFASLVRERLCQLRLMKARHARALITRRAHDATNRSAHAHRGTCELCTAGGIARATDVNLLEYAIKASVENKVAVLFNPSLLRVKYKGALAAEVVPAGSNLCPDVQTHNHLYIPPRRVNKDIGGTFCQYIKTIIRIHRRL